MQVTITSVPVEIPGFKLRRKRSEGPKPILPKGAISSLNSWAEKNNFPTCKFYDIDMLYPNDDAIEKYFRDNKTDVVGFSAVVSTSYLQVKRLARIIKKVNKKTLIVCGGYLTAAANTILRKTKVDICVVGDGEIAWVGILKHMKEHLNSGKNKLDIDKLLEVKGIALLDDNNNLKFSGYGQKLAGCNMTFPSFDYLKSGLQNDEEAFKNYFKPWQRHDEFHFDKRSHEKDRKPMMSSLLVSKGCVAKCTFCQRGAKGYMVYDLSKLEAHLKDLRDKYDVGFVQIDDENFGSNKPYTYQVADLLNKYSMLWVCMGVRCNSVKKEDLIYYKSKGCCSVKFGIESGSQTMLDIMEKKFEVDDIKKAIFACQEINLSAPISGFMVGMPGESLKTIRESGKLMGELAANIRVPLGLQFKYNDLCYALPLVGTPLYEYGKQLKLIGEGIDEEEEFLENTANVTMFKRYYMNFNGAPMSEVLFWDILVYLEATRTYVKLMKGKTENHELVKKYIKRAEIQGDNPQVKSKQKSVEVMGGSGVADGFKFSQYFITNFLSQHIIFNEAIAKLPRWLVDPIVRYMLYLEYLIQKNIFKDKHNLHKTVNAKVDREIRVKYEEVNPETTTQKDRSLRTIVAKKMEELKRTREETLISTLTGGP